MRVIRRAVKIIAVAAPTAMLVYLALVWVWATSSIDQLLPDTATANQAAKLDSSQIEILIKIEDPTFYQHIGLDLSNGQGLTTITSNLARNIFLYGKQLRGLQGAMQSLYRSIFDCCKRIDLGRDVMALVLDRHLSKRKQLRLFINGAYLGTLGNQQIIGFDKAAKTYYGKSLAALSDDEFTGIVAMLLAPDHYHPVKNPQVFARRLTLVKAVARGECEADGLFDLNYSHCAP